MIRYLFALLLCLCGAMSAAAADTLSADAALRDLRILKRGLTELHAGAFRYITPAQLDAEFERANAVVAHGTDRAAMFLLASRLAAAVRCGHTWPNYLNQSDIVKAEVFDRDDKLPLVLRLIADRLLIDASAVDEVASGSELLAIDGHEPKAIVAELMPYLRADGSSDGKRRAQIDHGEGGGAMDRLFPLLHPPVHGRYTLRIRDRDGERTLSVAAISASARAQAMAKRGIVEPSVEWTFAIAGDTAVLTLPTFAFWGSKFQWKPYLDEVLTRTAREHVAYLIVDIRANEGGDDAIGKALLARLLRKPYVQPRFRRESAYERVPYVLARFLDTWDFSFFDRTGEVVKGEGRNWLFKEQPQPEVIVPAATSFRGRTIVLIGPDNSSAGFLLARDIKASAAARLIGRTTGGNLRGLNGGQIAWITLPASGVSVDIALQAFIAPDAQADAGVDPDQAVAQRFDDAAVGIDTEMNVALATIAQWRAGESAH